jgi:hypothetical protein
MSMQEPNLPGWLKIANPLIVALQRRFGFVMGTMRVLSVPGRKSGRMHATTVSPLTVDGQRYVVGGFDGADWVKNARAAGWGLLARGRAEERIRLVELPVEESRPILRMFPREVPHGVQFFRRLYGVSDDPEEFAALAPRCPVFRIDSPGAATVNVGTLSV